MYCGIRKKKVEEIRSEYRQRSKNRASAGRGGNHRGRKKKVGEPGTTVFWNSPGKSVSKEEASEERAGEVRLCLWVRIAEVTGDLDKSGF